MNIYYIHTLAITERNTWRIFIGISVLIVLNVDFHSLSMRLRTLLGLTTFYLLGVFRV